MGDADVTAASWVGVDSDQNGPGTSGRARPSAVVAEGLGLLDETVTTEDDTPTTVHTIAPANDTVVFLTVRVMCGVTSGADGGGARAEYAVLTHDGVAGVSDPLASDISMSAGISTATVEVLGDAGNVLVQVTGVADTEIKWRVLVEVKALSLT